MIGMIGSTILGISGKKQSGKDSVASFLVRNCKELFGHNLAVRIGFADSLKTLVMQHFGATAGQVYGSEEAKQEILSCGLTVRQTLQKVGTVLAEIDTTVWVRAAMACIKFYVERDHVVVVPDVRFPKEVHAIHALGGKIIRLTRNDDGSDQHVSETALDSFFGFDHTLNNKNLSLAEQNICVADILKNWGWTLPSVGECRRMI